MGSTNGINSYLDTVTIPVDDEPQTIPSLLGGARDHSRIRVEVEGSSEKEENNVFELSIISRIVSLADSLLH
eukprot:scaffold10570_cov176-Amphora_coffeaeformis.AAC.11